MLLVPFIALHLNLALLSSLGNESDAGSASCCISSYIFGIQILILLKYQVLIPTKKLNFASVVLVEKVVLLAAAPLPYRRNLYQTMIPT